MKLKIAADRHILCAHTLNCTDKGAKSQQHTHAQAFTLAADLNWARQGLGGRVKQDRKYSSQMERWRGQRACVTGEMGRNRNKVKSYGKET